MEQVNDLKSSVPELLSRNLKKACEVDMNQKGFLHLVDIDDIESREEVLLREAWHCHSL